MAAIIARRFFSGLDDSSAFILTLLAFASGFLMRPVGALVFGRLGDRAGRKRTFLATLLIMGGSTFCVGLLPTYEHVGVIAPIALVVLRMLQGFALGGEYGGAAVYVAEFSPIDRRGFATSWIQATGSFGFMISLLVILGCRRALGPQFDVWGWRIPFLLSALLLAVSSYIRVRLRESPVFLAMRERGEVEHAPLREALGRWRNLKLVILALLGVTLGQAMVTYTGELYVLYFMTVSLKIDSTTVAIMLAAAMAIGTPASLLAGQLADRVGRKPVVLLASMAAALTFIPIFHGLTHAGNPALGRAIRDTPVTVFADPARCRLQFDPVGKAAFKSSCDVAKAVLTQAGVPYRNAAQVAGDVAVVQVGTVVVRSFEGDGLDARAFATQRTEFRATLSRALDAGGYPRGADPAAINHGAMIALLTLLVVYLSVGYGPLAAWLVEMFPPRIRYSAISLPYHIGFGWFGGFLPAIAFAIVARTGDIYAGLWYPVTVALMSVTVGWIAVAETLHKADSG